MQNLLSDNKKLSKVFFIMALAPLAFALTSQYMFGLKPCELCIFQRIPYGVILFFTFISILKPSQRLFLISTVVTIHAFLVDAGIAFYHVGVEKHWWVNSGCSSTLNMNLPTEELLAQMSATPAVSCDEVQFELLGISMAGWNFVYALIAAFFTIYILVKYFKFQKTKLINEAQQ